MGHNTINICRPGYGSSCALCCGSHNFTGSIIYAEEIYSSRQKTDQQDVCGESPDSAPHDITGKTGSAMACPHISINGEDGYIGCRVYTIEKENGRPLDEFFHNVCTIFFCRAREILTDEEIIYAARTVSGWYFYPILINDPVYLRELMREYPDPSEIPAKISAEIKSKLENRFRWQEI